MRITKGTVHVGDEFTWRGKRVQVISMDYTGVTVGMDYSKEKGFKKTIKFYYGKQ